MKKRLTIPALCIAILLACLLFFTACGEVVSIAKIEKTGSEGLVDTYTITLTNGETSTFTVTNGKDGADARSEEPDADAPTADYYFRFKLLEDDTYEISARYQDLPPRVVIPATHDGKAVTAIGEHAFYERSSVDEIVIPSSVTSIGDSAFFVCRGLTSITIPDSVTSIAKFAFVGCSGLTSISIPSSVTSIENGAFQSCTGLTSITIGNNVKSIGFGAFESCTRLTSISIPFVGEAAEDAEDHTYFGYFFGAYDFSSNSNYVPQLLETVVITGGTTISPLAFHGCFWLKSITIPTSVTSIGYDAFYGCDGLDSTINYAGTMEEWGAVSKDERWWNGNATVCCTDGTLSHQ